MVVTAGAERCKTFHAARLVLWVSQKVSIGIQNFE